MFIYKAIYRGKNIDVEAKSSYEAQKIASKIFSAKKSYEVSVFLNGEVNSSNSSI